MNVAMEGSRRSGRIWSIVLGGGDGGRMTDFIQRWLGYPRPKQYCTFVGDRSLFQHTLDRASRSAGRNISWQSWPGSMVMRHGPSWRREEPGQCCCNQESVIQRRACICH